MIALNPRPAPLDLRSVIGERLRFINTVEPRQRRVNSTPKIGNPRHDAAILGVLTLPFLLNDFSNIFVSDYRVWLIIDYVFVKAFPIAVVLYLLRTNKLVFSDLGFRHIRLSRFLIWTFAMTVVGIILDQAGSRFFARLLPDTRLGGMPHITDPLVNQVDLYIGLALVAVVEEVIFRGLYFTVLSLHIGSRAVVFLVCALAFGYPLVTWGQCNCPSGDYRRGVHDMRIEDWECF